MTGKKTDNKDCAIKNPDKWGAEKNENDNNRIERSVKDDDPAQAGFFLSPDSGAARPASPMTSLGRRSNEERGTSAATAVPLIGGLVDGDTCCCAADGIAATHDGKTMTIDHTNSARRAAR